MLTSKEFLLIISLFYLRKSLACNELSGTYGSTKLSTAGIVIKGSMPGRRTPTGKVQFENAFQCRGTIRFPDDREYKFWYNKNTCEIHWDKPQSTNVWRKNNCGCNGLSGTYGVSKLLVTGSKINGGMPKRPNYLGRVQFQDSNECRGTIRFPDDREYKFWYNKNTCEIHWDKPQSTNVWRKKNCGCNGLSGTYGESKLSVAGNTISGGMPKRPNYLGKVEFQDLNECRGKVRFPDDREYKFWYRKNTCEIHWDKPQSTNVWRKKNCGCEKMNGKYGSSAIISINGKSVSGNFVSSQRPRYSGKIDSFDDKECRGKIRFPDDRTYSFWFNKKTCMIYWGSRNSKNVWKKSNCN